MSDLSKMLHTVVSSLFKKTACEMYPVKPARFYKNSRGSVRLDAPKCILCTLCEKRCPALAIKVDRKAGTWEIDRSKCITCDECITCCRPKALIMDNQYTKPSLGKVIDKINVPKKEKPAAKKVEPKKAPAKTEVKKTEDKK
jgi:formate hydrogenlyase subunit 6/NADH:ubiquinone oxidoreductase subunit I